MTEITPHNDYAAWLSELKHRIQSAQQRAALSVNRELVVLYWHIGLDILQRQQAQQGLAVLTQGGKAIARAKIFNLQTIAFQIGLTVFMLSFMGLTLGQIAARARYDVWRPGAIGVA